MFSSNNSWRSFPPVISLFLFRHIIPGNVLFRAPTTSDIIILAWSNGSNSDSSTTSHNNYGNRKITRRNWRTDAISPIRYVLTDNFKHFRTSYQLTSIHLVGQNSTYRLTINNSESRILIGIKIRSAKRRIFLIECTSSGCPA